MTFRGMTDVLHSTFNTGLVYKERNAASDGRFNLFAPFADDLWIALALAMCSYALLLALLGEMDSPRASDGKPSRRTVRSTDRIFV